MTETTRTKAAELITEMEGITGALLADPDPAEAVTPLDQAAPKRPRRSANAWPSWT